MKIVKVADSPNAPYVRCRRCLIHRIANVMWADIEGKPFEDYYCPNCVTVDDYSGNVVPKPNNQ